jgi:hypothetical protein
LICLGAAVKSAGYVFCFGNSQPAPILAKFPVLKQRSAWTTGNSMATDTVYAGAIHPPATDRVTELQSASIWIKLKKISFFIFCGTFLGALIWLAGSLFELGWLEITGIALGIVVALVGVILALTGKVAPCPYCGKIVGAGTTDSVSGSDNPEHIECDHCFEPLVAERGKVRPLNEADLVGKDAIEVMALKDGVWPKECIVCGAPPTHVEEARVVKPEYAKLLIGAVSVQSGKLRGVPYCDRHSGAVRLNIRDDALRVVFDRLDMARRYLAVNAKRKAVKVG